MTSPASPFVRLAGLTLCISAAAFLAACGATPKTAAGSSTPAPRAKPLTAGASGYDDDKAWLCRPGRDDTCAQPLRVTTVAADGSRNVGPAVTANANAPIDCFYVYPTVSNDTTANSDLVPGPEELNVAFAQFSPLRSQCRLFAPMYRQVTIPALRSRFTATPMKTDPAMAYADVVAAWKHYLAHDNQGRGVVLVGHSQGSRMLTELVAREIEGQPVQQQIVSVVIPGSNVMVPRGQDVGGSFKSTPLCRAASQTGCAIAYVTFRSDAPPPADSLFGRATGNDQVACTNPAALAGGAGQPKAWFSRRADVSSSTGAGTAAWQALNRTVETPFYALPGLLTTRCVNDASGSYLAVDVKRGDKRTDDIGGDVVTNGSVVATWGLHLLDMGVGMGDLIDIVGQQSRAWLARKR